MYNNDNNKNAIKKCKEKHWTGAATLNQCRHFNLLGDLAKVHTRQLQIKMLFSR